MLRLGLLNLGRFNLSDLSARLKAFARLHLCRYRAADEVGDLSDHDRPVHWSPGRLAHTPLLNWCKESRRLDEEAEHERTVRVLARRNLPALFQVGFEHLFDFGRKAFVDHQHRHFEVQSH